MLSASRNASPLMLSHMRHMSSAEPSLYSLRFRALQAAQFTMCTLPSALPCTICPVRVARAGTPG